MFISDVLVVHSQSAEYTIPDQKEQEVAGARPKFAFWQTNDDGDVIELASPHDPRENLNHKDFQEPFSTEYCQEAIAMKDPYEDWKTLVPGVVPFYGMYGDPRLRDPAVQKQLLSKAISDRRLQYNEDDEIIFFVKMIWISNQSETHLSNLLVQGSDGEGHSPSDVARVTCAIWLDLQCSAPPSLEPRPVASNNLFDMIEPNKQQFFSLHLYALSPVLNFKNEFLVSPNFDSRYISKGAYNWYALQAFLDEVVFGTDADLEDIPDLMHNLHGAALFILFFIQRAFNTPMIQFLASRISVDAPRALCVRYIHNAFSMFGARKSYKMYKRYHSPEHYALVSSAFASKCPVLDDSELQFLKDSTPHLHPNVLDFIERIAPKIVDITAFRRLLIVTCPKANCKKLNTFCPEMAAIIPCGSGYKLLDLSLVDIDSSERRFILSNFTIFPKRLNNAMGDRNALLVSMNKVVIPNVIQLHQLRDTIYDMVARDEVTYKLYPEIQPLFEALLAAEDEQQERKQSDESAENVGSNDDHETESSQSNSSDVVHVNARQLESWPIRKEMWKEHTVKMCVILSDGTVFNVLKSTALQYWNYLYFDVEFSDLSQENDLNDYIAILTGFLSEFNALYSRMRGRSGDLSYDPAANKIKNMDLLFSEMRPEMRVSSSDSVNDSRLFDGVSRPTALWTIRNFLIHASILIVDPSFVDSANNLCSMLRKFNATRRRIWDHLGVPEHPSREKEEEDWRLLQHSFGWIQGARQLSMPNAIFCTRPYYLVRHDRKITLLKGSWCHTMFLKWDQAPERFVDQDEDAQEILRVLRDEEVQINVGPRDAGNVADAEVQEEHAQDDADVDMLDVD